MMARRSSFCSIGSASRRISARGARTGAPRHARDYGATGVALRRSRIARTSRRLSAGIAHDIRKQRRRVRRVVRTSWQRRGFCERWHQLDHPACRWLHHRAALRAADAGVRGGAVRAWPAAVGPGQPVECGLRRARGSGSRSERARMAGAVRACGMGGVPARSRSSVFRPISRIAPFASMVFLRVQSAAVVLQKQSAAAERVRWVEPPPAIYQFSSAQNVIHIVLDEFQSDVFDDIFHAGSRVARSPVQRLSIFRRSCGLVSDDIVQHAGDAGGPGIPQSEAGAGVRARRIQADSIFEKVGARRLRHRRDHDRPCRFVRAMDGTGGGAQLEGRAVPDPQAFREPGGLPRSLGAATARAVAVPPRAARGEGVQRRSAGHVLSADLDGSEPNRRHR